MPVWARNPEDEAVSLLAVAEVSPADASFTKQSGTFERTLLGDVVDLCSGPDAMTWRRREQIVHELPLSGSAIGSSPILGCYQYADLPDAWPGTIVLSPVDAAHEGVVLGRCDHQGVVAGPEQTVFEPSASPPSAAMRPPHS